MVENTGGEWKTAWMFRQNSTSKQNAHLVICVIPDRGELMEVALPGALMHAQIMSQCHRGGWLLDEPGSWGGYNVDSNISVVRGYQIATTITDSARVMNKCN